MNAPVKAVLLATMLPLIVAATASAQTAGYTACPKAGDAMIVDVSGATCEEARAVATELAGVAAADVEAVLRAQGWAPLRAAPTGYEESYDLFATRGRAALFLRRRGPAPDLESWTAGRELVFSPRPLVGANAAPRGSASCTSGPPSFVAGSARPQLGRPVCLTGRTSGIDRCGRIIRSYPGTGGIPCTTILASPGDSGSPVYTIPGVDGTVRAVGIAVLVFGPFQSMCFEPIGPVLRALKATLVTAVTS